MNNNHDTLAEDLENQFGCLIDKDSDSLSITF